MRLSQLASVGTQANSTFRPVLGFFHMPVELVTLQVQGGEEVADALGLVEGGTAAAASGTLAAQLGTGVPLSAR